MIQGYVPRKYIAKKLKIDTKTVTQQYIKLLNYCEKYIKKEFILFPSNDTIEVDELHEDWKDGNDRGIAIFSMVSRNSGKCWIECVRDKGSSSLIPIICSHCEPGATIISDGWKIYTDLDKLPTKPYTHKIINKKKEGFCRLEEETGEKIHVNRCENLNALIRKTIRHHSNLIMTHGRAIAIECMMRRNFKNLLLAIVI
jgi:hypothetical protein